MKTCSAQEMRLLDRRTMEEFSIPGTVLMENAGKAIAREALRSFRELNDPVFLLLAGKGNNGGDAVAAARFLLEKGAEVRLFLTDPPEKLSPDSRAMWDRLPEEFRKTVKQELTPDDIPQNGVFVDALLGTGCTGAPRGKAAEWISLMAESNLPVLAADIPSGFSSDDGSAVLCAPADITVTMGGPKTGMILGRGPELCGRIRIAEIGFPAASLAQVRGEKEVFAEADARKLLKKEPFDTFKNRRGHLYVVGGSSAYPSAPLLTAEGALRTGAGLVTVWLSPEVEIVAPVLKALIVRRLPLSDWERASAFAVGPGMTTAPTGEPLVKTLLSAGKKMVLDADGLNLLSLHPEWMEGCGNEGIVLTPHPGEMHRLQEAFRLSAESREEQALALAKRTGCTVLLKGVRTVVASPDGRTSMNLSGCPALATAGSGDVLTGVIGAFLANGYSGYDAARLGAFFHGLAGERLLPFGTRGIAADDLPQAVGRCLRIPS